MLREESRPGLPDKGIRRATHGSQNFLVATLKSNMKLIIILCFTSNIHCIFMDLNTTLYF